MTNYILLIAIVIIVLYIAKLVYKYFFSNIYKLVDEIINIPYSITEDCTFPSFSNTKIVKGEYPYVKFDYKEVFYLRDAHFKVLPIITESTIQSDTCYFSTVPAQLGYKLIRYTLYPNSEKIVTLYELIEIQERHLVFKKLSTMEFHRIANGKDFDKQNTYFASPALKKALEYVEFVLNFNDPRN